MYYRGPVSVGRVRRDTSRWLAPMMRGLARPSTEVVEAFFAHHVWVWGVKFGLALRCAALLCAVYVQLHLVCFRLAGLFFHLSL
jgi:hypothetical protein